MKINRPRRILSYAGRAIIRVKITSETCNRNQAFYLSSGRNSGMPNQWLPFDGLRWPDCWFDKRNYTTGVKGDPVLHRFGRPDMQQASELLAKIVPASSLRDLKDAAPEAINDYLCRGGRMKDMPLAKMYWESFRQARLEHSGRKPLLT